jgi:hypothetical protein
VEQIFVLHYMDRCSLTSKQQTRLDVEVCYIFFSDQKVQIIPKNIYSNGSKRQKENVKKKTETIFT